jgi:hypothetical protein
MDHSGLVSEENLETDSIKEERIDARDTELNPDSKSN